MKTKAESAHGGPGRTRTSNQTVMSAVTSSEVPIKSDVSRHTNQRMFTIGCGQSLAKRWLGNSAAPHSHFRRLVVQKVFLASGQTRAMPHCLFRGHLIRRLLHETMRQVPVFSLMLQLQRIATLCFPSVYLTGGHLDSVIDLQTAGRPIGRHPSSL
jgi:hypothetical protein